VRELRRQRVWFAQALLSSATSEIRPVVVQARVWAKRLDRPVGLWMSDKQDAFVTTIASEFAGVPHRSCANQFLRDLAKPVLELDSHAKVQMWRRIRGLRAIEREVLKSRAADRPCQSQSNGRDRSSPAINSGAQVLKNVETKPVSVHKRNRFRNETGVSSVSRACKTT
jgi:hypothetical protein